MKTLISTAAASLCCAALYSCASIDSGEHYASTGEKLYAENCYGCHREAATLNEPKEFIHKTIHHGGKIMPSFEESLAETEHQQIIDYILKQR
ncbi:MAG: cytochrome c [Pseudomonadota bacterium]|nr:cytochrome c [Pseudomonadota bacterium]